MNPVLVPILLAAYPVLSLFQHNQSEIDPSVLWKALAVAAVVAAALFVLARLFVKRSAKAAVLASLVVVAFSYYGIFTRGLARSGSDRILFPIWIGLFVLATIAVLRTKSDLVNLSRGLAAFAVVILVVPVYKTVKYRIDNPSVSVSDARLWPSALENLGSSNRQIRPDVYYIIPDDYARPDILKRYFRYDDSGFVRELEKRGFVMAPGARSPYSKSELNMAAALNMDYLSRLPQILGKSSQDVLLVRKMIEESRASHVLKALGYSYTHIDSDNITFAADNPHISPLAAPDNLTNLWLSDSVLRLVGGRYGFDEAATNERFRRSVRSAFDKLQASAREPGPKFVLFHTLMPHDPYIFGARGQAVTFPDHSDTGHSTRFGMRYYVQQLRYINTKLLEAVDAIRARSKTPPIIVIAADEGFEALPEEFGEATVQDMRVKGIDAFYLPGKEAKKHLPQKLNTVNSFRFLFNEYFGTHYPLLKSMSYPELDLPYQFEEMRVR